MRSMTLGELLTSYEKQLAVSCRSLNREKYKRPHYPGAVSAAATHENESPRIATP